MTLSRISDIKESIFAQIDVVQEYTSLGLVITGSPNSVWVACRAYGKEDRNPSAQICTRGKSIGQYIDFANPDGIGGGKAIGFFDFCAAIGKYKDYRDAIKYYTQKYGIKYDAPRDPRRLLNGVIWTPEKVTDWATKRNTTPEIVKAAGGGIAHVKLNRTDLAAYCITLPIYGAGLTADAPSGFVAWRPEGMFTETKTRGAVKMLTIDGSEAGLMGKYGLENLDKAEIVWKTEGPGDMLSLMNIIPDDLKPKHVVITNSAGCAENPKPWVLSLLEKKTVYIIGDADKPGYRGAQKWANALAEKCAEVKQIELPFPVSDNKGKDLRDWIAEGGTYDKLLGMAKNSPVVTFNPENQKSEVVKDKIELLKKIGIDVLGELPDLSINIYSTLNKKICRIKDVSKITYANLLQIAGTDAYRYVTLADVASPDMMTLDTVKEAIAIVAGQNRLTSENTKGTGIWLTKVGHVVLVGKGQAVVWNGVTLETISTPRYEELVLNYTTGETFWNDDLKYRLENYDPEDGKKAIDELFYLIYQWNWSDKKPDECVSASIVTGLIVATFIQSIFKWRPMVSIVGESESGKTSLIEMIVALFGRLGEKLSSVSEASIRQYVKETSKPLFLDEFEATSNRQKIFELLRTSSDGSKLIRGTQNQMGMAFGLKHIVWMLAIEINLQRAPDRNRFIEFNIIKPKRGKNPLEIPDTDELEELGYRLMIAAIYHCKSIQAESKRLTKIKYEGLNSREIALFVAPAAVMNVISQPPAEGEAGTLNYMIGFSKNESEETDQEDLLQTILMTKVQYRTQDCPDGLYTIGNLIKRYKKDEYSDVNLCYNLRNFLETIGVYMDNQSNRNDLIFDYEKSIFFSKKQIDQLLKGTRWEGQSIIQVLKRIDGAIEGQKSISEYGRVRGIYILYSTINNR